MQESIINKPLEIAAPLFSLALSFCDENQVNNLAGNYREPIEQAFIALEQNALENAIPLSVVQEVKYALCAFVDEMVLRSAWSEKTQWMAQPLQLQFFGEHLAGVGFFNRLSALRQDAVRNIDVLEVFYCCLQLGFAGMYRLRDTEKLLALQVDLRGQISATRGNIDPRLSPKAVPITGILKRVTREIPFWVIGSITAALLFFIYLGYSLTINHIANNERATLAAQHLRLEQNLSKGTYDDH